MNVQLNSQAKRLIENIKKEITEFEKGNIIESRFGKENINLYEVDGGKYGGIVGNIVMLFDQSIRLLDENELSDMFLRQIIKAIEDIPKQVTWMGYSEKPSQVMIEAQLSKHFNDLLSSSFQLKELISSFIIISSKNDGQIERIIQELERKALNADEMLNKINRVEQKLKSKTTFEVYETADERYKDMAFQYQGLFFIFCILFFIALCMFTFGNFFDLSTQEGMFKFIYFKITLLVLLGILITYFLKLAAFYRKKSEEAYQTQVELEAFPDFVADMDSNDILEIRKELVKCYFGKMNKNESLDKLSDDLDSKIKILSELMLAASSTLKENKKIKGDEKQK